MDPSARPLPLIVDLDDTLVRTDTLLEQVITILFKTPHRLPVVLLALVRGRAAFKRRVAEHAELDPRALPFDDAVLAHVDAHRAAGGRAYLVTAADQSIADGVAAHLGVFESAHGSDGSANNKGGAKADRLAARFPEGFAYAGDCAADIPVWRAARVIIVVGASPGLLRRLSDAGVPPTHVLPRARPTVRDWAKALRVHQWAKNTLILIPLFLSQQFTVVSTDLKVLFGWMCFNVVASSTYLLNDLSDLAADRLHPTKRRRALAAGVIHVRMAAPLAVGLLVLGLIGAFVASRDFGLATLAYVALTLAYTFKLKSVPLIDVLTIGGLFTVRIVAGMAIVDTVISLWLSTFTFVLFMSLALAKRTGELSRAARDNREIAGRGYVASDLGITGPLGVSTGVTAVVVMILYMALEADKTGLYSQMGPLFLIPVVLSAWILRIWLLAHRGTLNDDPVIYAIKDRVSWLLGAIVGSLWVLSVIGERLLGATP